MNQFLRDYDEYCAEVEWEKEMIRLQIRWEESLLAFERSKDPDQIILNLETDDE